MLPAKRLNDIKQFLIVNKHADVSQLAEMLDVTEVTIRKDLEKLESEGFLSRTHGGAILNETSQPSGSLLDFLQSDVSDEKLMNIAQIASSFINDNDTVFLSAGVTSRYFCHFLSEKKNVSVITNDLLVALSLARKCPNINTIILGGPIGSGNLQVSGFSVLNSLRKYYFDESFIDVEGITLSRGYSVSSLEKTYVIQSVMENCKQCFAMSPYTNFNHESNFSIGNIKMFNSVITNEHVDKVFKEFFFKNSIRLYATMNAT
jgi:DeoR family fructose operon transcriptional repressor